MDTLTYDEWMIVDEVFYKELRQFQDFLNDSMMEGQDEWLEVARKEVERLRPIHEKIRDMIGCPHGR